MELANKTTKIRKWCCLGEGGWGEVKNERGGWSRRIGE